MSITEKAQEIADHTPDVTVQRPQNVAQALAKVMGELPAIGKEGKADPKQGGYAYRGIEQITREAQRLFSKYGVVFVPRVTSHEIKNIVVADKPWTDTILTVEYDVLGPSHGSRFLGTAVSDHLDAVVEDKITAGPFLGIGRDNSDKGANKAMTQTFKYCLLQLLCISDAKDDTDGQTHEADAPAQPLPADPAAEEAMHELGELIKGFPEDERAKLQTFLKSRFGPSAQMDLEAIRSATAVAAGWPQTGEAKGPSDGETF